MKPRLRLSCWFALLALALVCVPSAGRAEVKRIEISSRNDLLQGGPFGGVGPYERLVGKVFFVVDPNNPRNASIVDLDKAPRNAQGLVEFSADLTILKPKDPSRANGVLLFDIVNRGRMVTLGSFNRANATAEYGDGLLMEQGYTIVAVGWQFDVRPGGIGFQAPIAVENGKPVTGRISTWFIPNDAGATFNLAAGLGGVGGYAPVDPSSQSYRLTERDGFFGTPTMVPRADWQFGREADGSIVYDPQNVALKTRFKPGKTYELTYEVKASPIAGLGFAAVRDLASALKYDAGAVVTGRYMYAFGSSQTGRFLRTFLYEGFTTDEQGRQAFDALFIHIAGASRGSFNERFAQPNGAGFHDRSRFPYSYDVQRDPATGKTDGLGARVPQGAQPKIFMTNSSTEYWGNSRVAALTHVSIDGKRDLPEPANVRIFLLAGTQHSAGTLPPAEGNAQLRGNTVDYPWALRALLAGLDGWVRHGTPPQFSRHPRLSDGTLIPHAQIKFPNVGGVRWPYHVPGGYRADLPGPLITNTLPFLVPQVDGDGNETSGIRLPEVAVPLATTSGWAFRSERIGAPTELLALAGSYLPFARTRADGEKNGDPRPSITERYANRADYLKRIEAAARRLADERYILAGDIGAITDRAGQHWDFLMREPTTSQGSK